MSLFFYFFIFLFGLCVGSFLNCVIYLLESKQEPVRRQRRRTGLLGRSFCPYCGHILSWKDLIPVLSFLILRGKCRYCQKPISLQYPLVEIATLSLFPLIFNFQFSIFNEFSIFNFQNFIISSFLLLIACFLIIIFVYDLKHYIIPDKVIYPAIGITFIYQIIFNFQTPAFFNLILSGFGAAGFFLAIVLISRGKWMGLGDVKLAFLMGLLLGFPNILAALFLAFSIGAIIGTGLIIKGKKTLKSEVPFGPFLIIGTFIAMFWGERIIEWYLSLLA